MTLLESERMIGAVLNGRWRLLKVLGEGGMGTVFAAQGTQGEGMRAVKVLHREFVTDPKIVERFSDEARTCARLSHPNIATVFEGATAEDGTPYLVMELLGGHPLSTFVVPGRPLPLAQALVIVDSVLPALGYAHAQGVVHRDLKPENLFVVQDPTTGVIQIKLLDFGIAKVMDEAGGMGSKTRTGMLLGTPGYMSPEQMKNARAIDARSDLFSVGVVLFEALTGVDPFPADTPMARIYAVLSGDPQRVSAVAPHLAYLEEFFVRAMAREPAQRFQSAMEMSQAFHTAVGTAPSGGPTIPTRSLPPPPAHGTITVPPPRPAPTVVTPLPSSAPPAPRGDHSTQMSPARPEGVPPPSSPIASGQVQIVAAPPLRPRGVPLWATALIAIICLVVGVGVGFALANAL